MHRIVLAALVATGFATPALATSGLAPDPASWALVVLAFGAVGLAARSRASGINRVSA